MQFTSAISTLDNSNDAIKEAAEKAKKQLGGKSCDFLSVFISSSYRADWEEISRLARKVLAPRVLIGCCGGGIIGANRELEWTPGVSVFAGHLPGVKLYPFHVEPEEMDEAQAGGFWIDKVGASPDSAPYFVLYGDPLTLDPKDIVDDLNWTYQKRPVVGGLVSGGQEAGDHVLMLNDQVYYEGAVGVAMTGNLAMHTIVSQGCRPIGRPYIITEAEENLVLQLAGRPAITVLHEALSRLEDADQELAQQGSIFAGLVIQESRQKYSSGDFLVRNIVGIDPDCGGIAIAEHAEVGQTLQFHLRDARTSRAELRRMLKESHIYEPSGALLFNCLGRGKSLYGTANHDLRTIRHLIGDCPIGGFFSNGEIGPVGSVNFLHGYTASIGLFSPLES